MKKRSSCIALIFIGAAALSFAQSPPAVTATVAPGEPEIVIPQIVLQVEDLSVEKVEAQLPPEEDLLPPVRPVPTLTEGELAVGEPTIPAAPVETEGPARPSNERVLTSDVQLGAGTMNMILGNIAVKTIGPDPRFSVQFHHETLDGFDGHDPGSGYNLRNDSLDGGLKFRIGGVETDLAAGFTEEDAGLQGGLPGVTGGPYTSVLSRDATTAASFSGNVADWLTLTAAADGGFDSLTLQGATPSPSSSLRIAPSLSARAKFGAVGIGLETHYWYRDEWYIGGAQDQLQRAKVAALFSLDLPATFVLQASAAYFGNTNGLSRFPFFLSVTGTPMGILTLSLEGGYKVVPYDMHDILSSSGFALPSPLVDDRGWYGEGSAQLSLSRDLAATFKASYMASDAMPMGSTAYDKATGLFPVTQSAGVQLSTNAGLRWGITQAISVSAGWNHQFKDRLFFNPIDAITAGIVALAANGRFGGSVTMSAGPIADGTVQQPILHISGFWKIIEAVKLQIDGDDLLAPLMSGPRWYIARSTYIMPGFRLYASLGVSL